MNRSPRWSVDFDVREDAPSIFVPTELLGDAVVGDSVTITSNQPATVRHGRIIERLDDDERGEFFVVSLD